MILNDYRGILPNAELKYSSTDHCYTLEMDNLFSNRELFALSKILIGSRALNKDELLGIISKLKSHTSCSDKKRLEKRIAKEKEFNKGLLRKRSQFMWPGPLRTIRFKFTGPSVQAILDRLPTARLIDKYDGKSLIEAEVYGDGIKMFLLSQGSWVKVVGPPAFVQEMKDEIEKMQALY